MALPITMTPATMSLPDSSPSGTSVSMTVNGQTAGVNAVHGSPLPIAIAGGPGNPTDWIAIAQVGAASSAFVSWVYLNGTQTPPETGLKAATVTLPVPDTLGNYEARLFANDSHKIIASAPFTATIEDPAPEPPSVSLTVNGETDGVTALNGSPLLIAVAGGPGNPTDWIAITEAGASSSTFVSWVYLNGTQTPPETGLKAATVTLPVPGTSGNCEARLFANDSHKIIASAQFTASGEVPPPEPPPVISANPTSQQPTQPVAAPAIIPIQPKQ